MWQAVAGVALLRALRRRHFALLWTGQTVSRLGDYLYEIALAWWVLQKTGEPLAVAGVLVFTLAPMVLFLLIGGVAGDRFSRPRLMLSSDLARGVIVGLVALLAFADRLEVWEIYLASLLFGVVDAFFQPAYAALVPEVVADAHLPSANALTSLSAQFGRIVGPAIGAGLVAQYGSATAFALNAITYFVSAGFLLPLLRLPAPLRTAPVAEADRPPGVLADLRAGLAAVRRSVWLWLTILLFALTNVTLAGPYSVALPFLVKQHLGGDVNTLGLLYAIFPIGYVLGSIVMGRQGRLRRRGWLIYGATIVAGVMLGCFGLPLPLVFLGGAALINGAALEVSSQTWTNTLQDPTFVPRDLLSRVSSIELLGSYALLPVGYGLTGWATGQWGPAMVFLLGGGLTALVAVLGLLHPRVREVD
jgi:DHA3 family tetracycline resistance protein-like MFS transporter